MYRIRFVKVYLELKETTTGELDVRKVHGELRPYGVLGRVGVECYSKSEAEEFAKQYEALYRNPERYRVTTEVFESNKLEDDMLESIDYVKVVKMRAEMLDSYMMAIVKCGGSPKSFIADIETMTVKEMIDSLAQNGVRFTNK
jgi:hypothetical protein